MNFSLVIPTRNRAQALRLTLQHLSLSVYPFDDFEVLVVDDGSQDETPLVLREWAEKLPLRSFTQEHGGTSRARNQAIEAARGRHIMFIDDDVLVPPDFLRRHARLQAAHPGHLVRGPVVNVARPLYPPLPALTQPWRHFSKNYLCTSNASIERELLVRAGLFDPTFVRWEDAELGVRLKRLGVRRVFDNQTFVYHWKPPLEHPQRLRVAELDGQAAAQLYKRYPGLRMWLRSGLHRLNRWKNRFLLGLPLPGRWRRAVQVEEAYLRAGLAELAR
ncbi:MAG: glycosyltransferase [Candidatus Eremiobacteraeota bacterium]|nr:glycosyltransferase [Candidatus Eremiobacteraeota bacterium]MCW5869180.1 glycosyltransferase [Candidatus Eremiobacteraeota bacterium]